MSAAGLVLYHECEPCHLVADPDLVAVSQARRFLDAPSAQVGAVLAAEIFEGDVGAVNDDSGVSTRYPADVDPNFRLGISPDEVFTIGERDLAIGCFELEPQAGGVFYIQKLHGSDEPITPLRDGLDEPRIPGVVAERFSEQSDGTGQGAIGDDLDLPDRIDELAFRHQLTRPPDQVHQHLHQLQLELDRILALRQAVETGHDEPTADIE